MLPAAAWKSRKAGAEEEENLNPKKQRPGSMSAIALKVKKHAGHQEESQSGHQGDQARADYDDAMAI